METPLPTDKKIKALNVEESRAKRLERQQARLRDRGGIFRPENRNTNLFDILCQATHRWSPRKARGRSRSRSVSPRKKSRSSTVVKPTKVAKSSEKPSKSKKSADATTNTERSGKDAEARPKDEKTKGKRKQQEAVIPGDDEGGGKLKKSRTKQTTTGKIGKAPRRTAKKSASVKPPKHEVLHPKSRGHEARPKRKRKMETDIGDDEAQECPPSECMKTCTPEPEPLVPLDAESTSGNGILRGLQPKGHVAQSRSHAQTKHYPGESVCDDLREESKPTKELAATTKPDPIGNAAVNVQSPPNGSEPVKFRDKASNNEEAIPKQDVCLPLQSKKRATQSRGRSKNTTGSGNQDSRDEPKRKEFSRGTDDQVTSDALAGAINKAFKKRSMEDEEPRLASKRLKTMKTPCEPATQRCSVILEEVSELSNPPKHKKKRARAQTEASGEIHSGSTAKRPKVNCPDLKGVLNQKRTVTSLRKTTRSKPPKSSKKEKGEKRPRAVKTISRQRKENTASAESVAGEISIQAKSRPKGSSGIPARVQHMLQKTTHDEDYDSDGEPDPIDFLS